MVADGAGALNLTWLRPDWIRRPAETASGRGIELSHGRKIAVIGLGYVGLPVAVAFARGGVPVDRLRHQTTLASPSCAPATTARREVEAADLHHPTLRLRKRPGRPCRGDFYIVTVPTPIDAARQPDLGALLAASTTVGGVLKRGDIVVYESTVYPGATEEDCVPVLERSLRT